MLLHEITALISARDAGDRSASVAQLEDTLTSGYAHALALEAERLRLEQRLGEAVRYGESGSEALAELAKQISAADRDLVRLRAVLLVLRDRAREARAAA